MDIDTGDSPHISQKPYNLPLKHADWVQRELATLEKAGVITRSISPWASPIVIVPKKAEKPGEPPRRRVCVDYRAINKLLPTVQKVGSKAKGVLTLVPLPKIDEIYAKLKGSTVYSTFDMRSGYHHMGLSPESQVKSAFVIGGPYGVKYEFKVCPFGLAQAPSYSLGHLISGKSIESVPEEMESIKNMPSLQLLRSKTILVLHYHDVCHHAWPVDFQ